MKPDEVQILLFPDFLQMSVFCVDLLQLFDNLNLLWTVGFACAAFDAGGSGGFQTIVLAG